jgi:hypothetical protein
MLESPSDCAGEVRKGPYDAVVGVGADHHEEDVKNQDDRDDAEDCGYNARESIELVLPFGCRRDSSSSSPVGAVDA